MRFIFTRLFYALLVVGFAPLSLSWGRPGLRWLALVYDAGLLAAAIFDSRTSRLPLKLEIFREFGGRFHIGAETEVRVRLNNHTPRAFRLKIKDEYPPEMTLVSPREVELSVGPQDSQSLAYTLKPTRRGRFEFGRVAVRSRSRLGLVWRESLAGEPIAVKVYPNIRRAREAELKALGARSLVAAQRRAAWRGEGRDFESLREYVAGDELRHISWSATARRGRLMTRQYQIERDQTILIALDAGRLMTARIGTETKFDTAIHAALTLMSAARRAGDQAGLVVFGRRVKAYVPPAKGREQLDRVLEALHAVEPELIEPSYTRAFEFIAA
ncbi:MAG: hypothetical protein QOC61_715, partial [Acidobacteriota bacterium]|nr:hypothetical protein [Acidobacteriota bacterium]